MTIIERSNVSGTFASRAQAEEAARALHEAGFPDEAIGLAGQAEVSEKLHGGARSDASEPSLQQGELVALAVRAGERWQEALRLLLQQVAFNTTQAPEEVERSEREAQHFPIAEETVIEEHLVYDPVTGPRVVLETGIPVASGGFGQGRDPALDNNEGGDASRQGNAGEQTAQHTFFGQEVLPQNVRSGSEHDPNVEPPRVR